MRMAKADLKIQRKNMEVSKSCILFFSVIIWISSWHITRARIAAAMGSTTAVSYTHLDVYKRQV